MTNILIVIPARYQSSRFPGKPLVDIHGKSMLQHVWEKCVQAIGPERVIVATDDSRIELHCKKTGIKVMLTSENCLTGTDRVYEVALKKKADVYINVQGDEPLISPYDIKTIIHYADCEPSIVFNAMCPIKNEQDYRNPNVPKVVVSLNGELLYMSRAPIPTDKQYRFNRSMKQVCIYAFPRDVLLEYGSFGNKTPLEAIEDLEILRLLEMGHTIKMVEVSSSSVSVDTLEDLKQVRTLIND